MKSIQMLHTFKEYEPLGPLGYLLMDIDGNMKLGLFESKIDKKLVHIMPIDEDYFILTPTSSDLDDYIKGEKCIVDIISDSTYSVLRIDGKETFFENDKVRFLNHIRNYFTEPIYTQKHFIPYPNFYYIFHSWKTTRILNNK